MTDDLISFSTSHRFKKSILYMLRAYYGENIILEIYNRAKVEKTLLSSKNIFQLAGSWDSVKDLPIDWSITVVQS
jgi:hypothetical protein